MTNGFTGRTSAALRFGFGARVNTNPSSSSIDCRFLLAIRSLDLRRLEGGELTSFIRLFPFADLALGVAGGESGYSFV
jgi:hypothetical protein